MKQISQPNKNKVIKIRKINIYESPILTVNCNLKPAHIVLDTGATASLISFAKARELKLKILPTSHCAVQVDGVSDLKVLGEVHTEFSRGNLILQFSGLVVNELGTDILGGTNFHKENDIYSRMAKDTIVIQGTNCFQSTPVEIMKLDENKTTAKLVSVNKTQVLMSGDILEMELPQSCSSSGVFFLEPKMGQGKQFCQPQVVEAKDNKIKVIVKTQNEEPVKIVKNSKPVQIRETELDRTPVGKFSEPVVKYFDKFKDTIPALETKKKTIEEILKEIKIDQARSMTLEEKRLFENTIKQFSTVLGDDLPGYNNYFGVVHASIQFASRARPTSHKTRMPSYGVHGQKLYNQKALSMVKKGVLVDPFELGIQPVIVNDAWVVKKQGSAHLKWEDCTEKDVRMVTGFDPVNKYLSPIPSKANDPMSIYTHLANWKYLGELDFADMYWQLKFNLETLRERKQLEYLCIRTVGGVLAYARGPNGLLGMDAVTDELTDKLLGDLVLEGKVVKLADNVYFGAETIQELHTIFHEIMKRCELSNLRIKPAKICLNIASADILGLHWDKGTLTPSVHKLDPLAMCARPKTVKGMRSFLGGVRFNEICLNSKKLANATQLLDELTPATKAGKEEIQWNEKLNQAFQEVQEICRSPLSVFVPKKGDNLYLVGDAAPSQGPGLGTKMVIQRKGSEKLLPSFNHGQRMKGNMTSWSPCEVEAFQLSQAIKKFKPFIRFVGTKTTALIDSRASVLAVQRLEKGQPSTSRRLQDLLTNISAENIKVLHISAKIPSPLLEYVDFASRHPVECDNEKCTICEESKEPNTTFFGTIKINAAGVNEIASVPRMSIPVWKSIQQSSGDLRKAAALLESGKEPHKKVKQVNDIRKYLRNCTLNKDGLVVAKHEDKSQPFLAKKNERIVIPKEFAYSYTTILHRKFNHPLPSQMLKLFNRNFFMLNAAEVIKEVSGRCEYPCKAMKKIPKETYDYQTETKPDEAGVFFNADVLKESGQNIFILRENLTSYTEAMFVKDETKPTLREAILILTSRLRSTKSITVRVDAQSSLKALKEDRFINEEKILLDVGSAKNKNKNSVAEKGIRELREEIVKLSPHGGKISETVLAKATRNLNSRIRHTGCSARELWTKRDQVSGQPLQFDDHQLSQIQYDMRIKSHESSAKYESRNAGKVRFPSIKIGDRIYIKSDGSKNKARDPYLVLSFVPNKNEVEVQKVLDINRKNPVRVHLQNVYLAESDGDDLETDDESEELSEKEAKKFKVVSHEQEYTSKSLKAVEKIKCQKEIIKTCQYCINMGKQSSDHDYKRCEALLLVRPGLRNKRGKNIKEPESSETDESSDENHAEEQDLNNLILFSDDDPNETFLVETRNSQLENAVNVNLLDNANSDENESNEFDNDADEEHDNEEKKEPSTDDSISPPSSPPTQIRKQVQLDTFEDNMVIQELDDRDDEQQLDGDDSDDAVRVPVIQHDGCCAVVHPPQPRNRLGARSLPGRSIENRNLTIDVPNPRDSRSEPGRLAHTGDVIRYFSGYVDGDEQVWLQATVKKMYLKLQRKYPTYYNVMNERGEEISLELLPGVRGWQILRGGEWEFVDDGERRPA